MSNKTSDKNVGNKIKQQTENTIKYYKNIDNIEEVPIDILRAMYKDVLAEREQKDKRIKELEEESRKKSIELICYQEELENSIANLAELEQKDKRIKELEEEKVELKEYNKIVSDRIVEYKKNSIPKQAVRDKIKELKNDIKNGNTRYPYIEEHKIEILQELLEGEEVKNVK